MPRSYRPVHEFIHETRLDDVPDDVRRHARVCLLDLIGVWAAGSRTRASKVARDHAVRRYGGGEGAVPMPFDGRRASPPGAAFAGAATIDAVDAHDGHQICKGHAGAALLPVLHATIGDGPDAGFDDFLVTLIIGYEIAHRCGLALHDTAPDYHSSGSWNAIGCAAMGARLRGFGVDATRHALGIAEYFGPRAPMMRCIDHPSMVKDSSSWGAMVGMTAIDLAETGFTGAPALLCEGDPVTRHWQDLGRRWTMREMNFKAYPVCRWAQPAVEALFALTRANGVTAADIKTIRVATFHEARRLAVTRPDSGDAAQYSLPFAVALAAVRGAVDPSGLTDEAIGDPAVLAMAERVELSERAAYNEAFPAERYADVELVLNDGRSLQSERTSARGNFDAPLSDAELVDKFKSYARGIVDDRQVARLASLVERDDNLPLGELLDILANAGRPG